MVNQISGAPPGQANETVKPATPKPQTQPTQKNVLQPSDTVKRKTSGGDVDHADDTH
jgi:hypothetical protein